MPSLERQQSLPSKITCHTQSAVDRSVSGVSTKPTNVFYVWYTELCRRQNSNPVSAIRPANLRNDQVLDFIADRIKIEDWGPFFNALRLDTSLHAIGVHSRMERQKLIVEADTEEKVRRLKKWFGCICTKYVLKSLIRSLCTCLKNTPVLTCLELDGILISDEFLQTLLKGLTQNKTLKLLSLKGCPINDEGCFELCETLHSLPNIEIINLSSCNLTYKSGECVGKLIKYQQINRYCESWHSSLRYEEPQVVNMAGIKRISLNNNPKMGDTGLESILNELVDDLWIKALDMQRCNITEAISGKIIETLEYNRSLEVADFRHNDLEPDTISRILECLKTKQSDDPEYRWCFTSTTLTSTMLDTFGPVSSHQLNSKSTKNIHNTATLRRQKTSPVFTKQTSTNFRKAEVKESKDNDKTDELIKAKEQMVKLYEKLKEEIIKRQEAEQKCEELQKQVDELLSLQKNQMIMKEFANMKTYINKFISLLKQKGHVAENNSIIKDLQHALEEVQILSKPYETVEEEQEKLFNTEVDLVENMEEKLNNVEKTTTVHTLFENITGKPIEDESDAEDFGINLDLSSSIQQSSSSYIDITTDSTRSDDSESVETMKRLLEELSKDDRTSSSADISVLSNASTSSEGIQKDLKKSKKGKNPQISRG